MLGAPSVPFADEWDSRLNFNLHFRTAGHPHPASFFAIGE